MNSINQVVIDRLKLWLSENDKSIQWLADEMGVSKSLVGHILTGERALLPKRIMQIAKIMKMSVEELISEPPKEKQIYEVHLRGKLETRMSKRQMSYLLFAIEDCVELQRQLAAKDLRL